LNYISIDDIELKLSDIVYLLHLRTILFFVQAVITLHTYFNDTYAREMRS